ncbi:MAG TPA: hypothetical protein VEZ71_29210 [Archangium sp.]|nr:hypothetical protein [Archangium sp.]
MCSSHAEFSSRRTHTARKLHGCDECQRPIEPGQRYVLVAGKWEGDFFLFRAHEDCRALADSLKDEEGCFTYGQLLTAEEVATAAPAQAAEYERLTGRPWAGEVSAPRT